MTVVCSPQSGTAEFLLSVACSPQVWYGYHESCTGVVCSPQLEWGMGA